MAERLVMEVEVAAHCHRLVYCLCLQKRWQWDHIGAGGCVSRLGWSVSYYELEGCMLTSCRPEA